MRTTRQLRRAAAAACAGLAVLCFARLGPTQAQEPSGAATGGTASTGAPTATPGWNGQIVNSDDVARLYQSGALGSTAPAKSAPVPTDAASPALAEPAVVPVVETSIRRASATTKAEKRSTRTEKVAVSLLAPTTAGKLAAPTANAAAAAPATASTTAPASRSPQSTAAGGSTEAPPTVKPVTSTTAAPKVSSSAPKATTSATPNEQDVTPATADDVWAQLRKCESGGRYALNTGNGYYGAYQFAAATWRRLGYAGLPHEAPPAVQDEAARKLQAKAGWGQWPACARKLGLR